MAIQEFIQRISIKTIPSIWKWMVRKKWMLLVLSLAGILYAFCLPGPLFKDPLSTVVVDQNGELLGAKIASDGQWRFPPANKAPDKFQQSLIAFEDKRFYYHPGVDPLAMLRAIRLNISAGEIVSGGSTISMQVIRLARKGKGRTFFEKFIEVILATRLELRHSKSEILALYASYAPFGGNVVGVEAASWKYYNRKPDQLSWAESAMLAVLPNAPSLIHPGKNRTILFDKRNRLLERLYETEIIDSITYELGILEPLPAKPLPLPRHAPHLVERIHSTNLNTEKRGKNHATLDTTTLDLNIQKQTADIIKRHYNHQHQNGVNNAAALVIDVKTGAVRAYVGNTPCDSESNGCAVDIIPSHRSSGSILKPFLYASMLDDGEILPHSLVADIPSYYAGYTPTNYDRSYNGSVPASKALARSLNIPAIRMLYDHGIAKFYGILKEIGMTSLVRPSRDYGLTLILGGAEVSLWDLAGIYASMARTLNNFNSNQGKYEANGFRPAHFQKQNLIGRIKEAPQQTQQAKLSASAIWFTFEAMLEVNRPENESFWKQFASSEKIAWKTGTSYGARDAWAVGCTPTHVVAVWVGNADGEGRTGLTGVTAAAPILFDIFDVLADAPHWFSPPLDEMAFTSICRQSGYKASEYCLEIDSTWIPEIGLKTAPCPYHQPVWLDPTGTFRVHSGCISPLEMKKETFFILPPVQETYYRPRHPDYRVLPPFRADCLEQSGELANLSMEVIYPKQEAVIYVPVNLDGSLSSTVFEAVHTDNAAVIYWHIDNTFVGKTKDIHELSLNPEPGNHVLTLVDERGEVVSRRFEILKKESDLKEN